MWPFTSFGWLDFILLLILAVAGIAYQLGFFTQPSVGVRKVPKISFVYLTERKTDQSALNKLLPQVNQIMGAFGRPRNIIIYHYNPYESAPAKYDVTVGCILREKMVKKFKMMQGATKQFKHFKVCSISAQDAVVSSAPYESFLTLHYGASKAYPRIANFAHDQKLNVNIGGPSIGFLDSDLVGWQEKDDKPMPKAGTQVNYGSIHFIQYFNTPRELKSAKLL